MVVLWLVTAAVIAVAVGIGAVLLTRDGGTGTTPAPRRHGATVTGAPGEATDTLTLTDIDAGEPFEQPVGSTSSTSDSSSPSADFGDVRSVDLLNRSWPVAVLCAEGHFGEGITDVEVVDGMAVPPPGAYPYTSAELDAPRYGDVTGDGIDDAVLGVTCSAGTSMSTMGMVLTVGLGADGEIVSLVPFPVPPEFGNALLRLVDVTIADGALTTTWSVGQPSDPTCCPSGMVTVVFRVDPATMTYQVVEQSEVRPPAG